jgi:hypothetical protein
MCEAQNKFDDARDAQKKLNDADADNAHAAKVDCCIAAVKKS